MTKRCRFCAEEIQAAAVICRFCGREQRIQEQPSSSPWLAIIVGAVILVFGGGVALAAMYAYASSASASTGPTSEYAPPAPAPPPPPPPLVVEVANEPYQRLQAGNRVWYSFELDDDRPCHLTGHIQVTEGGSHDVNVYVLDQDGFVNYQNGNSTGTYFNQERTSAVTLDLPLSGHKKYYLVISNAFSMFTGKTVSIDNVRGLCGDT